MVGVRSPCRGAWRRCAVRRLTTKSQFVALLYGQFSGAVSLREIVTGLESHAARLYHLGADGVRRSTLADANALRPSAVFAELLAVMLQQAHRGLWLHADSDGVNRWRSFAESPVDRLPSAADEFVVEKLVVRRQLLVGRHEAGVDVQLIGCFEAFRAHGR